MQVNYIYAHQSQLSMKRIIFHLPVLLLGLYSVLILNSCANSKKLAYFNNIQRDSISQIQLQSIETIISKNDVIQVSISTLDEATTRLLNPVNLVTTGTASNNGYLVDETGIIKLPLLGPIKAEGLTKRQLAALITNKLLDEKIAKDPVVVVRILNYKVTVLGEVNRPGVIQVPNERITLLDALGEAGDLTVYGRRNNILLIREVGDKRIYKRFSLNESQLFDKDIYNLQNQDIIYVEPDNARAAATDRSTTLIPLTISVISIFLVIYLEIIKK